MFKLNIHYWSTATMASCWAVLLTAAALAQNPTPYTQTEAILDFQDGPGGAATTPLPNPLFVLQTDTNNYTGTGGGWDLTASGAMGVGILGVNVAGLGAQTAVNTGQLNFNTVSSGLLGNLAGLSLVPLNWEANVSLSESNLWNAGDYAYVFDLAFDSSILGLDPNVLASLSLTIQAGATTLFSGTSINSILGLVTLVDSSYADVSVPFTYDPSLGELSITWSGNSPVSTGLLGVLTSGATNTLYTVGAGDIVAVPEPGALITGLAGLLLVLRRHRPSTWHLRSAPSKG